MATPPASISWPGHTACACLNKNQCGPARSPHPPSWKHPAEWGWSYFSFWWLCCCMVISAPGLLGSWCWWDVPQGGCVNCVFTIWHLSFPETAVNSASSALFCRQAFQLDTVPFFFFSPLCRENSVCFSFVSLHLKRLLALRQKVNIKSTKILLIIKLRIWGRWELMWELAVTPIRVITPTDFYWVRSQIFVNINIICKE